MMALEPLASKFPYTQEIVCGSVKDDRKQYYGSDGRSLVVHLYELYLIPTLPVTRGTMKKNKNCDGASFTARKVRERYRDVHSSSQENYYLVYLLLRSLVSRKR